MEVRQRNMQGYIFADKPLNLIHIILSHKTKRDSCKPHIQKCNCNVPFYTCKGANRLTFKSPISSSFTLMFLIQNCLGIHKTSPQEITNTIHGFACNPIKIRNPFPRILYRSASLSAGPPQLCKHINLLVLLLLFFLVHPLD